MKLGGVTKYTGNAAVIGDARIPVSQVYHCLEGVESEKHRPASKHPGFGVLSSGLPLVARGGNTSEIEWLAIAIQTARDV